MDKLNKYVSVCRKSLEKVDRNTFKRKKFKNIVEELKDYIDWGKFYLNTLGPNPTIGNYLLNINKSDNPWTPFLEKYQNANVISILLTKEYKRYFDQEEMIKMLLETATKYGIVTILIGKPKRRRWIKQSYHLFLYKQYPTPKERKRIKIDRGWVRYKNSPGGWIYVEGRKHLSQVIKKMRINKEISMLDIQS